MAAIGENSDELVVALAEDFGQRNSVQSFATDITAALSALRHSQKRVRKWMKDGSSPAGHFLRAAGLKTRTIYQPLGVVGIISPWNFPVTLSVHPLGQAFAAGNRAMLKVSEVTGRTGNVLARVLSEYFEPSELAVIEGGPEVAAEFCRLPFDHIFFTGSTATGRRVMEAAAVNLVPVTLELGGQCPVVIDHDVDLKQVATALIFGKTLNAGQFCVAPDHAYVPENRRDRLVEALTAAAQQCFPNGMGDDATAVINQDHFKRLCNHLSDARAKGAQVLELVSINDDGNRRLVPPTLVLNSDDTMSVCREELFGPILPIHTYSSIDDVIQRINARPRPLAAYYFGKDTHERERFLQRTVSGGVTLNDILLHVGVESMPFGGVGASGTGKYHGRAGFETFSHAKSVVEGPRRPLTRFARGPYSARSLRTLRWHASRSAALALRKRSQ
jgi:coniferyl-aldehyde dehydrogenase